jgi:hypothetical protein
MRHAAGNVRQSHSRLCFDEPCPLCTIPARQTAGAVATEDLMLPSRVQALIDRLVELTTEAQRRELVVFGSTAIVLGGAEREKEPDDVDVFASDAVFAVLEIVNFSM